MTTDDELIEAMLVAMYDDGCPGAVDSMRAVLALVREHDNRLSLARELGQAEAALKAMRAELQSLRERDGRDAERWRHWRLHAHEFGVMLPFAGPADMDSAIDAAIARGKE